VVHAVVAEDNLAGLPQPIASVKSAGLEGLVAKRRNTPYEPDQVWRLAEDENQPWPGIRHWRVHAIEPELRCADIRLLL